MPDNPQIPNPTARRRHLIPRSMPLSMMRAVYPTIQRTGRPKFTICGNPTGLTARKMSGGTLGSGQRPADPRVRLATQRTDTSPPSPRRARDRVPPCDGPAAGDRTRLEFRHPRGVHPRRRNGGQTHPLRAPSRTFLGRAAVRVGFAREPPDVASGGGSSGEPAKASVSTSSSMSRRGARNRKGRLVACGSIHPGDPRQHARPVALPPRVSAPRGRSRAGVRRLPRGGCPAARRPRGLEERAMGEILRETAPRQGRRAIPPSARRASAGRGRCAGPARRCA